MRSLYLFLLFVFVTGSVVTAKDDFMVAFSVTGKIKYTKNSSEKRKRLKSGTVLFPEARLILKKRAQVNLYYAGEYQVIKGPGTYTIANLMKTVDGAIEDRFAELMMEDYLLASTGGKGTGTGKSGIGYGNSKFAVVPIQPYNAGNDLGKVSNANITFKWAIRKSVAPSTKTFKFSLQEKSGKEIYQSEVKGFKITIDASSLSLKPGTTYRWEVEATTDEKVKSPEVLFEYTDGSEQQSILQELSEENLYQSSSPVTQLFFQAGRLEENGYYYAAFQRFRMAIKKYKKNPLLRKAYENYLERHDLLPEK